MRTNPNWFSSELRRRGVSRREFVAFCATTAAAFALPKSAAAQIAQALKKTEKPILLWLEFQDCAGNSESFLRASRPTAADALLDVLSLDYHETVMAAAGIQSRENRDRVVKERPGQYIAVVEGSIPTGADGAYCTIGGESALDIARTVCGNAAATIAIGTCAAFGGLPAAAPNPTGALSVADAVSGVRNLINLPACPANVENLTELVVYYLTFKRWPALDQYRRPLFAYGKSIHDNCERRAHYDAGQYVEAWGDDGHQAGHCLYRMGCKGPVTFQNCPVIKWNGGTNWPIGCGHPCIGCAEPNFWDTMTPFYKHLPSAPGFGVASNLDTIGIAAVAGVGAAFAGHGLIQILKRRGDRLEPVETRPSSSKSGDSL
jgi:hydrogenase small subunit